MKFHAAIIQALLHGSEEELWCEIDSQDPEVVVWAYEELRRRRQDQPDSLIKEIIFVTIE
jgi:hypothetical protein